MNERFRIRSKSLKLDVNANHDCDRTTRRDRGGRTLRPVLVLLATLLCATFAALAWAGNGPASPNINLDVHNHASNGSDGYTNTTASNGATYSYRYSGGEGRGGDVVFHSRGRVTVNLRLSNGSGYSIEDVTFTGDTHHQLSRVSNPNASSHAVIQDRNDAEQTAQYKITVHDEGADVSVPCDPMIANRS